MGNSSARTLSPQITSRFSVVRWFEDINVYLLEQISTRKQYLMRELRFSNKNQFQRTVAELDNKRKLPPSQYVTPLKEFMTRTEDEYCLSKHKVLALFEYPHHHLEGEILERSNQKKRFEEAELWSILASCIIGLAYLEKKGLAHQCLRSDQVLLENDSGRVRIADPFCSAEGTNYQLLFQGVDTKHVYPAPEICHSVGERHMNPPRNLNQYHSDVFTMGMIMLEVGLLQSQDDCYFANKTSINWQKLNNNLSRFTQRYGPDMRGVIEEMLKPDWKDRPDWIAMQQAINKSNTTTTTTTVVQVTQTQQPQVVVQQQVLTGATTIHSQPPRPGSIHQSHILRAPQPSGLLPGQVIQTQVLPGQIYPGQMIQGQLYQPSSPVTQIIYDQYNQPHYFTPISKMRGMESNITERSGVSGMGMSGISGMRPSPMPMQMPMPPVPPQQQQIPIQDMIGPVQPSNAMTVRPKFSFGYRPPIDNYETKVRIDTTQLDFMDDPGHSHVTGAGMKFNPPPFGQGLNFGYGGSSGGILGLSPSRPNSNTPYQKGTSPILPSISQGNYMPSYLTGGLTSGGGYSNFQSSSQTISVTGSSNFPSSLNRNFGNTFKTPSPTLDKNLFGGPNFNSSLGNVNSSMTLGNLGKGPSIDLSNAWNTSKFPNSSLDNKSNLGFGNATTSGGFTDFGSLAGSHGLTDFSKLGIISNYKRPVSGGLGGMEAFKSTTQTFGNGYSSISTTAMTTTTTGHDFQGGIPRPRSQEKKFIAGSTSYVIPLPGHYLPPSAATTNVPVEGVKQSRQFNRAPPSPVLDILPPNNKEPSSTNPSESNYQIYVNPPSQIKTEQVIYNTQSQPPQMNPNPPPPPPPPSQPQTFNVAHMMQNINFQQAANSTPQDTIKEDFSKFGPSSGPPSTLTANTFTTVVGGGSTISHTSGRPHFTVSITESTPEVAVNPPVLIQEKVGGELGDSDVYYEKTDKEFTMSNPFTMSFEPNKQTRSQAEPQNPKSTFQAQPTTQSIPLDQQSNFPPQPQNPPPLTTADKIKIIDRDTVTAAAANAIQPLTTLAQSQQLKNLDNALAQKTSEMTTYVVETFKQGSRYEGEKVNGMRHGKGKFYYQDGGLYDGEWKMNRMDGNGKLYYQSGKLAYNGQWKEDRFNGHGILYNECPHETNDTFDCENFEEIDEYWTEFEGQFKDDLKEGKGVLYLSNGDYFQGDFHKDAITGQGVFHSRNGNVFKGVWQNNRLVRLQP